MCVITFCAVRFEYTCRSQETSNEEWDPASDDQCESAGTGAKSSMWKRLIIDEYVFRSWQTTNDERDAASDDLQGMV